MLTARKSRSFDGMPCRGGSSAGCRTISCTARGTRLLSAPSKCTANHKDIHPPMARRAVHSHVSGPVTCFRDPEGQHRQQTGGAQHQGQSQGSEESRDAWSRPNFADGLRMEPHKTETWESPSRSKDPRSMALIPLLTSPLERSQPLPQS
jgi:hypothetical protein